MDNQTVSNEGNSGQVSDGGTAEGSSTEVQTDDDFQVDWNEVEKLQEAEKKKETKGASVPKGSVPKSSEPKDEEESSSSEDGSEGDDEGHEEEGPKLIKVKVAGKEYEITEEEAAKAYELAIGARQKFNEAAKMRKEAETKVAQVENFLKNMKTTDGIMALIEYSGVDMKSVFKAMHAELTMPEDKRRLRDIERREAALKGKEEEKLKAKEEAKAQAAQAAMVKKLTLEIGGELKKAGIEQNAHNIKLVSQLMLEGMRANSPVTAAQATLQLKAHIQKLQAEAAKNFEKNSKSKVNLAQKPIDKSKSSSKAKDKSKVIRPITDFGAANIQAYYDQWSEMEDDED